MTNLEQAPTETVCDGAGATDAVQVLEPRDVPLGGVRAMTVRRTLPQRARSLIGAWCFLDHYGPDDVSVTGGMRVPPHPHTGLQTVSWLFSGEIEHRDSLGTHVLVRPGQLNLMTAGHGISHSEDSTARTTLLHGVQLWTALPAVHRDTAPAFQHYAPPALRLDGVTVRVFLGALAGEVSPVPTFSPLVGAELLLDAGSRHTFVVDPDFEHGVLVDRGEVQVAGAQGRADQLLYLPPGRTHLTVAAGDAPVRLLLLGGEPLGERIVMWWNFVGRSHEDVVQARAQWQAEIGAEPDAGALPGDDGSRFGHVADHPHAPLPAPVLPPLRLTPRG
ncbi:pirin family protein [Cellulomonas sp. SG140]|uniref:pirin family protein n=1 Tax=Cellulomonas sp. SG140 TaxID=2976536 RepID=UPI0021E95747|nr:pirin family protein [Cellulomonas sp. SG140]